MALVPLRRVRTSKPPIGTPIDWTNPLTLGLVGSWSFNEFSGNTVFDAATSRYGIVSPGVKITPAGALGTSSGSTDNKITVSSLKPYSQNWPGITVLINCNNPRGNTFTGAGILTQVADGALNGAFNLTSESSGATSYLMFRTTHDTTLGQTGYYPAGASRVTLVGKWDKTNISAQWFADTGESSSGTMALSTAWTTAVDTAPFRMLQHYRSTYRTFVNVPVHVAYVFSRALSQPEIQALSFNPWQIYEPEIIWITVGGGPTGIIGSLDTALAAWNISAAGKLAISGQSNQTAALTGLQSGTILTTGQATQALAAMSGSQAGVVAIVGAQAALAALLQSATGAIGSSPISGAMSSVSSLSGSTSGTAWIQGIANQIIASMAQSATGVIGTPPITGSMSALFADLSGLSSGQLSIAGMQAGITILTGNAAGAIAIHGTAAQVMAALSQIATGRNGDSPAVVLLGDIFTLRAEPLIYRLQPEQRITALCPEQRIHRLPGGNT